MMHRVGFFSEWVGDGQINSGYCSFCPSLCLVCRSGQSGPHNFYSRDELAVTVSAPIVRRFVQTSGGQSSPCNTWIFPKTVASGKVVHPFVRLHLSGQSGPEISMAFSLSFTWSPAFVRSMYFLHHRTARSIEVLLIFIFLWGFWFELRFFWTLSLFSLHLCWFEAFWLVCASKNLPIHLIKLLTLDPFNSANTRKL